jgi:hypothetical protein
MLTASCSKLVIGRALFLYSCYLGAGGVGTGVGRGDGRRVPPDRPPRPSLAFPRLGLRGIVAGKVNLRALSRQSGEPPRTTARTRWFTLQVGHTEHAFL